MTNPILQNPTTLTLNWRAFVLPILVMAIAVMAGFQTQSAHAQGPITQPTTGASTTESIDPTTVATSSDGTSTVTESSITETGAAKSFLKIELLQQAKRAFTGRLDIESSDFKDSVDLSLSAGEDFSPYFVFTEQTGPYKLNLYSLDSYEPILWVEGHIERLDSGVYQHQFLGGRANPDYLELPPEEAGVVISLGWVDATLSGCVYLYQPLDGRFELGVDANGDGEIGLNETTTQLIRAQTESCLDTPESSIPLTSLYRALVTDSSGNVVAKNEGLYDFLNKTSVSSDKESDPEMVREFRIEWTRTPTVVQRKLLNDLLRSHAQPFEIVPKVKGKTAADIIQNLEADSSDADASESDDAPANENPFSAFIDYWVYIAIGAGLAIALVLTLRGLVNTPPISKSKK